MKSNFWDLIRAMWAENRFSIVTLGPSPLLVPKEMCTLVGYRRFLFEIVDQTGLVAAGYLPERAFFESLGLEGSTLLREVIAYIHTKWPKVPVILEATQGLTERQNQHHADYFYDHLKADAVIVSPYEGASTLTPFLRRPDRGVIVICRTVDGDEVQTLGTDSGMPMFMHVARRYAETWNTEGNVGLLVGSRNASEVREVRRLVHDTPLFIPSVWGRRQMPTYLESHVGAALDHMMSGFLAATDPFMIHAGDGPDSAVAAGDVLVSVYRQIGNIRQLAMSQAAANKPVFL